ncbi:MAG TPA: apolipoprotein N-acyltransferase [Methylovirgula sp.]|nr:apolipoprotein N-acyltransferase [Methylovirgula sp.]
MSRIAEFIILSGGWPRRAIAFLAGAIGALALAPVDFLPAVLVPMTVAVWLIDGAAEAKGGRTWPASIVNALGAGWWWGFGYFVAGFWWLGSAFLVEPDYAWALPLGVLGLPAFLAFFPALGFALARAIWGPGLGRILALAAGLGFSEWLRGHALSGFPWNDYGMALGTHLVFAQLAAVGGLGALNVATIAIFATPALVADRLPKDSRRIPRGVIIGAVALAAIALFGTLRLSAPAPKPVAGVKVRLMQPNIAMDAKFTTRNRDEIVADYLKLSDRATGPEHMGLADVSLLVWPESAFPFILTEEPQALAAIGGALPAGTTLVTGAVRIGEAPPEPNIPPHGGFYNSILAIGRGGIILDTYDKVHLVPFGEYLPLDWLLHKFHLHHFVHVPGGFEKGAAHMLLTLPNLPPAVPLICYEAIFPEEAVPASLPGMPSPGFMLNVTDDGWFGRTSGPYQHFAQARLTAIEQGLPLLRAANTGISAIVDPYGRILGQLPLGEEGVIDGVLPGKIAAPPFARAPVLAGLLAWIGALLLALGLRALV